mmetsp:Transcript_19647/g.54804  ORF Transcript_19647/g.54804 Transcript_19647/m.54804 type:complete len:163 (+) Transcript_19647:1015-1503(+)
MRGGTRPHHKPSTSHPSNYCVNAPRVPCPITGPSKARRTSLSSCLLPLITTPTQATRNGAMPVLIWVLILGSQGWLSTIHFGWCLTLGKLRHKLGSCALWYCTHQGGAHPRAMPAAFKAFSRASLRPGSQGLQPYRRSLFGGTAVLQSSPAQRAQSRLHWRW